MKQPNLLFSLLLIVFFTINSNAQIVYTEVPASLDQGQDFHIDFNNDGTAEFNVYTTDHQADYIDYDGNTKANIHALGTNESGWDVPDCVAAGFTIDASNNWIGQGDCSITNWGEGNSSITTDQDEYLAVRFSIGKNTYYGWIRIEVDFENNVTFKDYAYNSTPKTAINAGDKGDVLVTSISVAGESNATTITTQGGTLQMIAEVLPANATDNSVTWSVSNGTGNASIDANGLLTAIADGTVTVTATANDASGLSGSKEITISNQSVGINNLVNNKISIYPNPAKDVFTINNLSGVNISDIRIYNLLGKEVKRISGVNSEINMIDISELNKGVYLISMLKNDKIISQKKLIVL